MPRIAIPVTVTAEFKARVEDFVEAIRACTSQRISSGVNSSTVCHVAIEEMLERYEKAPEKMALKLGFSPVRPK
jgi:hypothetical protein